MSDDRRDAETYILEVTEAARRYMNELRRDNQLLRELVSSLNTDGARLREQVDALQKRLREQEAARQGAAVTENELVEWAQKMRAELEMLRRERAALEERVAELDGNRAGAADQYAAIEEQYSNLTSLYVASYRLHETLDRAEVIAIIEEIVINIVGSEELGIFELGPDGAALRLIGSFGIDAAAWSQVPVGDGVVARAIRTGATWVRDGAPPQHDRERELTACVPLRLDGRVTGAILVFRLLEHKKQLAGVDHELFELLATHAATALYCTGLHAATRGRVQTGHA